MVASSATAVEEPVDIRMVVLQSLRDHGIALASSDLAVVNEGSKTTVTIDASKLLSPSVRDIQSKLPGVAFELRAVGSAPKETPVVAAPSSSSRFVAWDRQIARLRSSRDADEAETLLGSDDPAHPVSANEELRRARALNIARQHLEEIRSTGVMYGTVALDGYWQHVLSRPDDPNLFNAVRPEIHRIIQAGLQPYRSDGTLNARQFAELALRELNTETHVMPVQTAKP